MSRQLYELYKKNKEREDTKEWDACPDCTWEQNGTLKFRKLCHMHDLIQRNEARREDNLERYSFGEGENE